MDTPNITDPAEQTEIGDRYYSGKGAEQDYEQAAYWYANAADQGNANAQYYLGLMYYHGEGVTEDDIKAYELIGEAADQGHTEALEFLYGDGHNDDQYDGYI